MLISDLQVCRPKRSEPAACAQKEENNKKIVQLLVLVEDLPATNVCSMDLLQYFEDLKHGGPVKSVTYSSGDTKAQVCFVEDAGKEYSDIF